VRVSAGSGAGGGMGDGGGSTRMSGGSTVGGAAQGGGGKSLHISHLRGLYTVAHTPERHFGSNMLILRHLHAGVETGCAGPQTA
jgi:hypothetical protein